MAGKKKKYKNIKLEQNELTPTPIGLFENRKKSSIGTVLILAIFILVVVFLPQISEKVNEYLNPPVTVPSGVSKPKPVVPEVPGEEKENFFEFVDNLKVTNTDITVSNIKVDTTNITLSYDVTNNFGEAQNLEELNYYLEIFNKEQTLVERVKLADERTIASGAFYNFKRNISSDAALNIGFISLVKKTTDDYPDFTLKGSSDGNGSLVCSNGQEKVTYKFGENKLKDLTSEVNYLNTESDYQTKYDENKINVNTYNNKVGVVSTLFEYEGGYNITTTVNLSEASRMYIFNADSFKLDTEPKVVKFEMEAQGFKCE